MIPSEPRVGNEQLSKLWRQFAEKNAVGYYQKDLNRVHLGYGVGQAFDLWIYEQGGWLGKEHGKRFAQFNDEQQMIMFVLKWL